jgi:hypothetical protein
MRIERPAGRSRVHRRRSLRAAPLTQRLLNIVLLVTVLTSTIAFIEPSPHDGLMIVLFAM